MDKLPLEIYANIVDQLIASSRFKVPLASYAAISSLWKLSIERHTFRDLRIETTELDEFAALFNGENISRRAALRKLYVTFILPTPSNGVPCCDVEGVPSDEADSVSFTTSVVELALILSSLGARSCQRYPLYLVFSKARRTFPSGVWKTCDNPDDWTRYRHGREQRIEARANFGQFEIFDNAAIPFIDDVTSFYFHHYEELVRSKYTWIPRIARCIPNLETFVLQGADSYQDGRNRRILKRHDLCTSVLSLGPGKIQTIIFLVHLGAMENELLPVHELVPPELWERETWNRVVEHFATFPYLQILHLAGGIVVCPSFFSSFTGSLGTSFKNLKELVIEFSPATADGRWFFQRDDKAIQDARADPQYKEYWDEDWSDHSDSETNSLHSTEGAIRVFGDEPVGLHLVHWNVFRSLPDIATFHPFLMGAAKAAGQLQRLERFLLQVERTGKTLDFPFTNRYFQVWFLKAGTATTPAIDPLSTKFPKVPCDVEYQNQNRLYWAVGNWQPWKDVHQIWLDAFGPHVKEMFFTEGIWRGDFYEYLEEF